MGVRGVRTKGEQVVMVDLKPQAEWQVVQGWF